MKRNSPPPEATDRPDSAPTRPVLVGDSADDSISGGATVHLASESADQEADEHGDTESGSDYNLPGKAWQGWVFAMAPIVVILLGAGREAWSRGLAAVVVGLLLLVFPARRKLPPFVSICLLGAVLAPLLTFLPASWQGSLPDWRTTLENDWGVAMSHTLSPQAWVSWEAWIYFAICLVWLGWCLARGFSTDQRRGLLQALTLGGIGLCVLTILEHQRWIGIPWWPRNLAAWGNGFGPFANRNHASSMAAIVCVLAAAAAYDANRRRSRSWIIFVLGMIAPVSCVFLNTSRAGVLLLFVGFTTWFGTVAMRKGFFKKMAMMVTLVCVIAVLILMSGGGVSTRLKTDGIASTDMRITLLAETLSMTTQMPWLGAGLGNFESLFPLLMDLKKPRIRVLHPESDVMWLLAEGGLLTLVPAVLLVLWIFNATGPWFGKKKRSSASRLDRRLRNAAAIAFGLGALHGMVDVPNHSLGFALLMAVLAGIAVRPRRLRLPAGWSGLVGFRLAGLAMLAAGYAWFGVALGHGTLPGRSASEAWRARANARMDSGSIADGISLMNEAIRLAPMNAQLYFERARMTLFSGGSKEDALMDFSRCRRLEPHYALFCYQEGVTWLDFDASYAIIGWREFLQRYPDAAPGTYGYFRQMISYSGRHPELQEPLWSLASTTTLKLDFLASLNLSREDFDRHLQTLLSKPAQLEAMEASQRETLFELWGRFGDEKSLAAALETNRKWRDNGWRWLATYYARNSDFRSACQTAAAYLPSLNRGTPGMLGDVASLERALLFNPTDARAGVDLFQAQKNSGDTEGALRTLEKVAKLPSAPVYVRQEMAALLMAKGDFRRAWEQFQVAMEKRS